MAANVEDRMVRLENRVDAVVHDVGELKGAYSHLATKADIEALKGWMLWRISAGSRHHAGIDYRSHYVATVTQRVGWVVKESKQRGQQPQSRPKPKRGRPEKLVKMTTRPAM